MSFANKEKEAAQHKRRRRRRKKGPNGNINVRAGNTLMGLPVHLFLNPLFRYFLQSSDFWLPFLLGFLIILRFRSSIFRFSEL